MDDNHGCFSSLAVQAWDGHLPFTRNDQVDLSVDPVSLQIHMLLTILILKQRKSIWDFLG